MSATKAQYQLDRRVDSTRSAITRVTNASFGQGGS